MALSSAFGLDRMTEIGAGTGEAIMSQRVAMIVAMALSVTSASTLAQSCKGVDQKLSAARKQNYALLVAGSIRTNPSPSQVLIDHFMGSGKWSIVWASPPDLEEGAFFFEQEGTGLRFMEVWGGYALPSEKLKLIRWAHALGPNFPDGLATCFADYSTRH